MAYLQTADCRLEPGSWFLAARKRGRLLSPERSSEKVKVLKGKKKRGTPIQLNVDEGLPGLRLPYNFKLELECFSNVSDWHGKQRSESAPDPCFASFQIDATLKGPDLSQPKEWIWISGHVVGEGFFYLARSGD